MRFSSLPFLFGFLPITLAIYFAVPLRWRNLALLLASLVFYGWGLALVGRFGLAFVFPFTAAIFAAQVAFSGWWLARFRFGPLEWLWRSLTYGRAQPMRLARPAIAAS